MDIKNKDNYIYRKGANKNSIYGSDVIFDVAKKHNASVYDLNTVMGGYKSIYKWYKAGYARKDKVHFTAKGYGIIGDLMWDAINRSYKSNSKI